MSTTTTNLGLIKLELTDPADITAMNENWDKIDEELSDVSQTVETAISNITPENIGAAPSGYGYGEQMVEITSPAGETYEEYCAKIDALLADMQNRQTMQINATPPYSEDSSFGACAVTLYKGTDAYASLVTIGHSNKYAYGWRMQKRGGVWEAFEWIDPPMNVDVVYRTIERYNGNAVYKKLSSDGVLYWSTDKETWNTYITQAGITYGTTDLTAGTSALGTGKLYFIYE